MKQKDTVQIAVSFDFYLIHYAIVMIRRELYNVLYYAGTHMGAPLHKTTQNIRKNNGDHFVVAIRFLLDYEFSIHHFCVKIARISEIINFFSNTIFTGR